MSDDFSLQDHRTAEICALLRSEGKTPFVRYIACGDIEIRSRPRGAVWRRKRVAAIVDTDGHSTRWYDDGTRKLEKPPTRAASAS